MRSPLEVVASKVRQTRASRNTAPKKNKKKRVDNVTTTAGRRQCSRCLGRWGRMSTARPYTVTLGPYQAFRTTRWDESEKN